MVRQRHPPQGLKRDTHISSPIDYAKPSGRFYSSESDVEPVTGLDVGAGSITDGSIVDGGLDGTSAIKPGTYPPGAEGPPGPAGETLYTWSKYADDALGTGMTDDPTGKKYIGLAFNKPDPYESGVPTDYAWSLVQGPQGVPGSAGSPGPALYTWVKYADNSSGGGMSDDPTGKTYVGFSYNHTSPVESTVPTDYAWSPNTGTTGPPGPPGTNGQTLYTWAKYADDSAGTGMADDPTGKTFLGLAYNKTVATESTVPTDYTWSLIQGPQGVPGTGGPPGPQLYTWVKYADTALGAGMSDDPTGKAYIGFAYNKSVATESSIPTDYAWSLTQGATGPQGPPGSTGATGPPGPNGETLYTWVKYADTAVGGGINDNPSGKAYIGLAYNKTTPVESNLASDYAWSLLLGPQGAPGSAGAPGTDGATLYTWVKYATSAAGAGINDNPGGMSYIGLAHNKTSPVESTNPVDYQWSLILGPQGPQGPTGPTGPTGPAGADATRDTSAPPTPIFLTLPTPPTPNPNPTSVLTQQADGTPAVAIIATVGYASPPGGLVDLAEYVLQSTRFGLVGAPDWTNATQWRVRATKPDDTGDFTGSFPVTITQPGAVTAQNYWLRVAARDLSNNQSPWSTFVTLTSVGDVEGPPQPKDIVVSGGMQTLGVRWSAIQAEDIEYVEVQWRLTSAPDWVGALNALVAGTVFVIVGLTNDAVYSVRLRSVDRSGNTRDVDGVGVETHWKVDDLANAEKGWVVASTTAKPSAISAGELVWDTAAYNKAFVGKLNADWLYSGNLRIGLGAADADAIIVYDAEGHEVGRWSSLTGIVLTDPARVGYPGKPNYKMTLDTAGLKVLDTSVTPNLEMVTVTPLGIDAASIRFGSARGGHNLVQNSSFEMGGFAVAAITPSDWTVLADWNAAGSRQGTDTNIVVGAGALTMTP